MPLRPVLRNNSSRYLAGVINSASTGLPSPKWQMFVTAKQVSVQKVAANAALFRLGLPIQTSKHLKKLML
jgi:hypothetical protein